MSQINIPDKLRILNSNQEVSEELISFITEKGFLKIALITTKTPNHLIANDLEVALFDKVKKLKTFQVIDSSIAYANQLPLTDFDLVIGIGGGKIIDTAKYASHINKIPCISIPTAISNDGICSPVAVLKEKQNKYKSLGTSIPVALFVPLHLIKRSDEESIVSGIGDLLSNLSAIEDCKLANKEKREYTDDYAVMVSKQAALSVYLELENYILQGKTKTQFLDENLNLVIEALALSGIAMEIAGTTRPASGAEHLISHSIDELFGGLKPHGVQVAFGMYITTFLRAELGYIPKKCFEELETIFRFVGLPITISSVGITKEQLIEIIIHAPQTRPERYTILNRVKLDKKFVNEFLEKLFESEITVPL
ncbi:MAG: iron-containing alcohol dehydrogenase family protein [Candidatus Melainabacteria bacterium]|nr:iron-containing alcohol dehydrogenase family protein [Candidatus Melainabacteria bacterium]